MSASVIAPNKVEELIAQFEAPVAQPLPQIFPIQTGAERSVASLRAEFEGKKHPFNLNVASERNLQKAQAATQLQSDLDYAYALELEAEEQEVPLAKQAQIDTDRQLAEKLQVEEMVGCLEETFRPSDNEIKEEQLAFNEPPKSKAADLPVVAVAAQRSPIANPKPQELTPQHQLALLFMQASLQFHVTNMLKLFVSAVFLIMNRFEKQFPMKNSVSTYRARQALFHAAPEKSRKKIMEQPLISTCRSEVIEDTSKHISPSFIK